MVTISVIIPVYNVEKYLRKCLESVINQTFRDIEIICIDDGSSDNSLKILREYERLDTRIKIISQENKGVSAARNEGLRHATGDYIYFIDSDDYLVRNALERLYNIAIQHSTDLIIFKLINFEHDTRFVISKRYHEMSFLSDYKRTIFNHKDIKDYIFNLDVTPCTKFFKKELLDGICFYEGLIFEDNILFVDYIFKAKRIYYYDECLYNRRIRKDSITRSYGKNHMDIIPVTNIIFDKIKEFGCYDEFETQLFNFKMYNTYLRLSNISPEFQEEFFQKIKKDFLDKQREFRYIKTEKDNLIAVFSNILKSNTYREFEVRMENYDYSCALEDMGNSNQELISEINSLKKELNKVKSVNSEIMSSNSWKITAPFRAINRFLNNNNDRD